MRVSLHGYEELLEDAYKLEDVRDALELVTSSGRLNSPTAFIALRR